MRPQGKLSMSTNVKKRPGIIRASMRKDKINPVDFMKYDFRFACEDCTHYCAKRELCTLGYISSLHRKDAQLHQYNLSGNMALCRFHEID